jgi:hypothetical protein
MHLVVSGASAITFADINYRIAGVEFHNFMRPVLGIAGPTEE